MVSTIGNNAQQVSLTPDRPLFLSRWSVFVGRRCTFKNAVYSATNPITSLLAILRFAPSAIVQCCNYHNNARSVGTESKLLTASAIAKTATMPARAFFLRGEEVQVTACAKKHSILQIECFDFVSMTFGHCIRK